MMLHQINKEIMRIKFKRKWLIEAHIFLSLGYGQIKRKIKTKKP